MSVKVTIEGSLLEVAEVANLIATEHPVLNTGSMRTRQGRTTARLTYSVQLTLPFDTIQNLKEWTGEAEPRKTDDA